MMFWLYAIVGFLVLGIAFLMLGNSQDEERPIKKDDHVIRDVVNNTSQEEKIENDYPSYLVVDFPLAGLYYRGRESIDCAKELKKGEELYLEHEKNNTHDKYAVRVEDCEGIHLGYVPAYISKKIYFNIDKVVKVIVDFVLSADEKCPSVYCKAIMSKDSLFYWEHYLNDYSLMNKYKIQFPELNKLSEIPFGDKETRFKILNQVYKASSENPYITFLFVDVAFNTGYYEEALEVGQRFIKEYNLYGFDRLEHILLESKRCLKMLHDSQIHEEYVEIYNKGCELLKDKKYEDALQLFLRCMDSPYHVQAIPKNICKCYDKLKRTSDCVCFAKSAMKRDWLTENTISVMNKYIDKYKD